MRRMTASIRRTIAVAAIATAIVFGASAPTFARSASRGDRMALDRFLTAPAAHNLWLTSSLGREIEPSTLFTGNPVQDSEFPKPDFSALEKWYEIKKWEYDIYNSPPRLNLLFVIKSESRPWNFGLRFEDADGVLVSEPQICGHNFQPGAEVGKPLKCWVWIPSEKDMKKVKTVRAVKRDT